jgi:hypothetical protein
LNLDSRISRFVVRKFALSDHLLRWKEGREAGRDRRTDKQTQ